MKNWLQPLLIIVGIFMGIPLFMILWFRYLELLSPLLGK